MQNSSSPGFRERPHTADWALDVWAPDFPQLLEAAAQGMYALMGVTLDPDERRWENIDLGAEDREGLLVVFLSELLYRYELEQVAFDRMELQLEADHLHGKLEGGVAPGQLKEIKAVTYHKLQIIETGGMLRTTITFDV